MVLHGDQEKRTSVGLTCQQFSCQYGVNKSSFIYQQTVPLGTTQFEKSQLPTRIVISEKLKGKKVKSFFCCPRIKSGDQVGISRNKINKDF